MDFQSYFCSDKMFLIAGQCVIESRDASLRHAEKLKEICVDLDIPFVYKSSYRKANRTAYTSFTGLGIERGLAILDEVKKTFDVPVCSDVHEVSEIHMAAEVLDVIQTPAFLMRQSDMLTTAGLTGKVINIKKAQFASPYDMQYAVEKVRAVGNSRILLTERGTSFGYGALVVDMRSFDIMNALGYPTIIDCTHAVQMRQANSAVSGGERQFIPAIAKAAIAAGAHGVFAEVHEQPDQARSDSATQFPLEHFPSFLEDLLKVYHAA